MVMARTGAEIESERVRKCRLVLELNGLGLAKVARSYESRSSTCMNRNEQKKEKKPATEPQLGRRRRRRGCKALFRV